MNFSEKFCADARNDAASANDGIRKTAVFLSILDENAANEMLARLDPAVARAVETEMKRVENLAPEYVEAVVAEFLALNEKNGENATFAAPETSRLDSKFAIDSTESEPEPESFASEPPPKKTEKTKTNDDFNALDAFDAETLAKILRGERASTVAVVASRLSGKRRAELERLLPRKLTNAASRLAASLKGTTETSQFLEDAVFDRALDDE